jgi:N-acyl-D-amino-acid deacylase
VGRNTDPMEGTLFEQRVDPVWVERAAAGGASATGCARWRRMGVSPNVGSFLGGGTLRTYAKGMDMGPADADELAVMRRVMAEAMEDGAFGLSYALIYPPDAYVDTAELVEVCRAMAPYGGVYITHLRTEADGIFEALEEAIAIGREAGVPVEVYHLKASRPSAWFRMPSVIERIHRARADGIDVTADMYPYPASGRGSPPSCRPGRPRAAGSTNACATRRCARGSATSSRGGRVDDGMGLETRGGPHGIMPVGFLKPEHQPTSASASTRSPRCAARTGSRRCSTCWSPRGSGSARSTSRWTRPTCAAGAAALDQVLHRRGRLRPRLGQGPRADHPRGYGTYPRVLRKYVREERLITLEDAVRKMTSSVADRLSLRDRGLLRAGFFADVVLFDPDTIADRATFDDPHQLSVGVRDVWVNGDGCCGTASTRARRPGRFVKGPGA